MTCYDWKGGIGTSSRQIPIPGSEDKCYKVGVLVQANQGSWDELVILGAPVGPVARLEPASVPGAVSNTKRSRQKSRPRRKSSIIVVIATDAPFLPHQLKRLARRGAHGIARTGTVTQHDSGELCIAFSTAADAFDGSGSTSIAAISNEKIDDYFTGVVEATEEAIINALIANQVDFHTNLRTMVQGVAQPHIGCSIVKAKTASGDALSDILAHYHRM
jgi:L-aminopeptidase/D-esterase-like protein